MKSTTLLLVTIALFFVQCDKVKSKKWLFAEIEVRDEVTNELIDAELELEFQYRKTIYNYSEYEIEQLGKTTNGRFQIEKKFEKEIKNCRIRAKGTGYYHYASDCQRISSYLYLKMYSENQDVTLNIKPFYRFDLSFKNIDCFDETDSLFFGLAVYDCDYSSEGNIFITDTFVGCFEGVSELIPLSIGGKELDFYAKIKRDGIEERIDTRYFLEPHIENHIIFEY